MINARRTAATLALLAGFGLGGVVAAKADAEEASPKVVTMNQSVPASQDVPAPTVAAPTGPTIKVGSFGLEGHEGGVIEVDRLDWQERARALSARLQALDPEHVYRINGGTIDGVTAEPIATVRCEAIAAADLARAATGEFKPSCVSLEKFIRLGDLG